MSVIQKLSFFPLIFFKVDPSETQISLFSLVPVAEASKETKKMKRDIVQEVNDHNIKIFSLNTLKKICLHVANFKVPTLQIVSDNSFYKDP